MGNMSLQMFKYVCWPVYIKICMAKFTTVRSWVYIHRGDARIQIQVKIYSMAERRFSNDTAKAETI